MFVVLSPLDIKIKNRSIEPLLNSNKSFNEALMKVKIWKDENLTNPILLYKDHYILQ